MNAISLTTPALEGEAIEHAGIEPTLDGLIAAAEAGHQLLNNVAEDDPAYEAAELVWDEASDALEAYKPQSEAEFNRKYSTLRRLLGSSATLTLGQLTDDFAALAWSAPDTLIGREANREAWIAARHASLLSTASLAGFEAVEREYDRVLSESAGCDSTTAEGQEEEARLSGQLGGLMNQTIETPCSDLGAALAKLKWLKIAFDIGETGRETEVVEQIEGFLRALAGEPQAQPNAVDAPDDDQPDDIAKLATTPFEPWPADASLMGEDDWRYATAAHHYILQVALKYLKLTKDELVAQMDLWAKEQSTIDGRPTMMVIADQLNDTAKFFQAHADMAERAFSRLVVAQATSIEAEA